MNFQHRKFKRPSLWKRFIYRVKKLFRKKPKYAFGFPGLKLPPLDPTDLKMGITGTHKAKWTK